MKVFISYCHEDIQYKSELVTELGHLNRLGGIDLWDDGLISPGRDWREEIERQLSEANAAFLLLSNAFLGSSFCQDQEVPRLLLRNANEGLLLYPVAAQPCSWKLHEWVSKLQLVPVNRKREVVALSEMSTPKRKRFYASISEDLHNRLTRHAAHETGRKQQLDSSEERVRFARRLASDYCHRQMETLRELVTSYKWLYEKGLTRPALHLVNAFCKGLSALGQKIVDEDHRDVISLLRAGFPLEPVHLKDLSSLEVNSLLGTSGYPALMLGIRLTEGDHSAALHHLRGLGQRHRNLSSCAVLAYAIGQCHRKLGDLDEAHGMLDLALDRISGWKQELCECGPQCPKDGLLVEIHRGIATIFRKGGEIEKAQQHFELARQHLTEKVSDIIRSDFLFSYGYFIFERAVLVRDSQFQARLASARDCFESSSRLRPQWGAPLVRLQICKQLMGEIDLPGFWKARQCCMFEQGVEAGLSAVVCGFAILLDDLAKGRTASRGLRAEELFWECDDLFETRLVAKGARACHAFDIEAARESRPLDSDRWLHLVFNLVRESAGWDHLTLNKQREHLEDFRRSHGLKKSSLA